MLDRLNRGFGVLGRGDVLWGRPWFTCGVGLRRRDVVKGNITPSRSIALRRDNQQARKHCRRGPWVVVVVLFHDDTDSLGYNDVVMDN